MQPTNQLKRTAQSRCMYCGSPSYGKGCRYGPHGVHFHPDDSTKCAFCGSPAYGRGCRINPTSDLHVHGINYNAMFKEGMQQFLDNKILVNELKKPITNFEAFKLGIIDETGNKIKTPITEEEKAAFGPFVKTVLKLKRYLGTKLDLLEASNQLLQETNNNLNLEQHKKVLQYQDKLSTQINQLYMVVEEAQKDGLSLDQIWNLIKA